ncbi:MAG: sigma-70 family RNA polymerase sigma factor [Deltaproteobacteria bacterium]|nr:sigma-70 family RNA polymerase sigma factor [Deltaproteobacteria bacterium]
MHDQAELPEQELVARIIFGEKDLFREIVVRYEPLVYRTILRSTGDAIISSDLTQDTFLRAYTKLPTFRFESKLSTWVLRIALNLTSNHLSSKAYRQSKRTSSESKLLNEMPQLSEDAQPERELQLRVAEMQDAIRSLSPKYREVVILCSLGQRTYAETAEILGIPVGTVRSRMNAARQELRTLMAVPVSRRNDR